MRAITTAAAYAPTAALSSLTNGGSLVSAFYYNSRLQPCLISIRTAGVSPAICFDAANLGNVLNFTYNFLDASSHNNGNVASITNNIATNRTQSFTYDSLNRITSAQTSATNQPRFQGDTDNIHQCWSETYSYDAWGNLLAIKPSTSSLYTGCSQESGFDFTNFTGTNNRITASGYTYDAAGNLITSPGPATVVFNAENQLVCAGGTTYLYDGDGKRVEKETGCAPSTLTPATLYWYGAGSDALLETSAAGQAFNSYVFFNGQRVAKWTTLGQGGVNWFVTDHLGTSRYVWSTAGADISDFYPFGGERVIQAANGTNNRYKFTGKERDSESGLDNFGARFDSSTLGRFMSPDPLMASAHASDPRTWNRYTYALDNPLNFVDPAGMENCDASDKQCIHVKVNVIFDKNANGGKGLTDKQKQQFENDQLDSAKKEYKNSHIALDVTYTAGSINRDSDGNFSSVSGAKMGSINVVVTDHLPLEWKGAFGLDASSFLTKSGMEITGLGHELSHVFEEDLTSTAGVIKNAFFDIANNLDRAYMKTAGGYHYNRETGRVDYVNPFERGARQYQAVPTQDSITPKP